MDEAVREREPFHWRTAISYKTKARIVVRGYDLTDLVGNLSFTEMAYLVWRGELPSAAHARMLDALLVSLAEHAFSPSAAACRFVASGGVPLHVGVAGGMLAIGTLHGTADRPAELFQEAGSPGCTSPWRGRSRRPPKSSGDGASISMAPGRWGPSAWTWGSTRN